MIKKIMSFLYHKLMGIQCKNSPIFKCEKDPVPIKETFQSMFNDHNGIFHQIISHHYICRYCKRIMYTYVE